MVSLLEGLLNLLYTDIAVAVAAVLGLERMLLWE